MLCNFPLVPTSLNDYSSCQGVHCWQSTAGVGTALDMDILIACAMLWSACCVDLFPASCSTARFWFDCVVQLVLAQYIGSISSTVRGSTMLCYVMFVGRRHVASGSCVYES